MANFINELAMNGLLLLVLAILAETLTEVVKNALPKGVVQDKATYVLSLVIGVALAYAFSLNLFGLEGIGAHVSIVSAGLIASRGANFVNGFVKKFDIAR